MRVGVHKVLMSNPGDVSGLERLIDKDEIEPSEIVALIEKTEGNGGANDFTRALATLSFSLALAKRLSISAAEVAKRVAFVWSGGTEGVLSPHATIFTRRDSKGSGGRRLAMGIGLTTTLCPRKWAP
jgi:cyanuric acid amidohydrolase